MFWQAWLFFHTTPSLKNLLSSIFIDSSEIKRELKCLDFQAFISSHPSLLQSAAVIEYWENKVAFDTILIFWLLNLKERTSETTKNVLYFTSKSLFGPEILYSNFWNLKSYIPWYQMSKYVTRNRFYWKNSEVMKVSLVMKVAQFL